MTLTTMLSMLTFYDDEYSHCNDTDKGYVEDDDDNVDDYKHNDIKS